MPIDTEKKRLLKQLEEEMEKRKKAEVEIAFLRDALDGGIDITAKWITEVGRWKRATVALASHTSGINELPETRHEAAMKAAFDGDLDALEEALGIETSPAPDPKMVNRFLGKLSEAMKRDAGKHIVLCVNCKQLMTSPDKDSRACGCGTFRLVDGKWKRKG